MQRHPYEWPSLAENQWPNHGRKLTTCADDSRRPRQVTSSQSTKPGRSCPVDVFMHWLVRPS
jgi:hypothetical protein